MELLDNIELIQIVTALTHVTQSSSTILDLIIASLELPLFDILLKYLNITQLTVSSDWLKKLLGIFLLDLKNV